MKQSDQFISTLNARKEILSELISMKENALKNAPDGRLRTTTAKGYTRYYYRKTPDSKTGIYLPKDSEYLIRSLMQKDYDETIISSASREMSAIEKYFSSIPDIFVEDIYDSLSEDRQKRIVPFNEPDDVFLQRWLAQPYPETGNQRKPHPVVYDDQGTALDSKSEMLLSTRFGKRQVPKLPQFPIQLRGYGTVFADFKVLNLRTRKEYVWEHLGMLDSAQYRQRNLPKLNAYIMNGFIPGINLILSWESEECRLDLRVIDMLIEKYLL